MITDDVVELAARTAWESVAGVWAELDETTRESERGAMREALEAAAPLIAAKAWEEGYQACRNRPRVDGYLVNRANPYQTRADAIMRGES